MMALIFFLYRKLTANLERDYGKDDEYSYQSDGKLKERFFHAPFGPEYRIGLAENTTQAATTHLE
jgi:hypothetical protein